MAGNTPKTILRIIVLLVLAAVGVSLFFYKDITNYYREWQTRGSSEESIALPSQPQNGETGLPGNGLSDPGQNQTGTTPNYGLTAPDPANLPGPEAYIFTANAQNATGEGILSVLNNGLANGTAALSGEEGAPLTPAPVGGVEVTSSSGQQVQVGGVAPPLHEDSVVSKRFVYDLASFMVSSYYPPGTHNNAKSTGYVNTSLFTMNVHYGAEANKFFNRSRVETLQYVLAPSMLEALYRLYASNLLATMQQIAGQEERQFKGGPRLMTDAEQRMMFNHYAVLADGVAAVFEACAASPAITQRLDAYYLAAVDAYAKNQAYIQASIAHEQAQPSAVADAKVALTGAKAVYEQSVIKRESARDELLRNLKRYPGVRALDDSNILYSAGWINRRLADKSADSDALAAVSRILNNLAERMRELGRE